MQFFSRTHATFLDLRHLNLNITIIYSPEDTIWVAGLVYLLELAPLLEELELHVSASLVDHGNCTCLHMNVYIYINEWLDILVQIDCDRFGLPARTVTAVAGPRHRHRRSAMLLDFVIW